MGALGAATPRDWLRPGLFALVLGACALLGSGTWSPRWFHRLEDLVADLRWRLGPSAGQSAHVAVIEIDEASLDVVGPWPWPREVVAGLAGELFTRHRARVVALDMVFPEPRDAAADAALLALSRRHRMVFSQAFYLTPDAVRTGHPGGALPAPANPAAPGTMADVPAATGHLGNFFAAAPGDCVGHITPQVDADGVVRRMAPVIGYAGRHYPMLAAAALLCARPGLPAALPWTALAPLMAAAKEADGFVLIPWRHASAGFPVFSAVDVLARRVPAQALAGRYVLVGASALGLSDHVVSPHDPRLPGVMAHAEMLDWLLAEAAAPSARLVLPWLGWAWTLATVLGLAWLSRGGNLLATYGALTGMAGLWLLVLLGLPPGAAGRAAVLPVVAALMLLLLQAPAEWALARAQARQFQRRFRRYLPPAVMEALLRERGYEAMLPMRRTLTVLFADMEGYTALAETMAPERLVKVTEIVLEALTAQIHAAGGTVDKYMGDAVMAFWNAPLDQPDHADRGLACACAILSGMPALNARLQAECPWLAPVRICIGLHSGDAVVGEIGSPLRKSYTAIGDTVNIASRLQDLCKAVSADLLVGEGTAALALRHVLKPVGRARLRGRSRAEQIYAVRGRPCPQPFDLSEPAVA